MYRRRAPLLIVAILLAGPAASAQRRAHLAKKRADFDGDGRQDQVTLSTSGTVAIELGHTRKTAALSDQLKPKRGTIEVGALGGGTVILVRGYKGRPKRNPAGAAAVYWVGRGAIELLWRGSIGPQGVDREWSRDIELTSSRLVLYESHPQVRGCSENQPLRLYARAFDFGRQRRFRPFQPRSRRPSPTATHIRASDKPPTSSLTNSSRGLFFSAQGATSQLGRASAAGLAAPREIDDGDAATAWVEGRGGSGAFETIVFTQPSPAEKLAAIAVLPGHGLSAQQFRRHGRLKRFALHLYSEGRHAEFVVDIDRDPASLGKAAHQRLHWVRLPEGQSTSCVELVVLDTYRGTSARGRRDDLAISEVQLITEAELSGNIAKIMVDRVRTGSDAAVETAIRALRRLGAAGVAALVAAFDSNPRAEQKRRLYRALADIDHPSTAIVLGLALLDPVTTAEFRQLAAAKLASHGDRGAKELRAVMLDDRADDRARELALAALLRTKTADHLPILTEVAGLGSRQFRRSVALAIAKLKDARATALATSALSARSPAAEADLWRAASIRARSASASEQATVARSMNERLATVSDYERRYRLVQGMAPLPAATEALVRWWESTASKSSAEAVALRRVAAAGAAKNPHPEALVALALRDPDPGVRARGAAIPAGSAAASTALMSALASDPWPMVRSAAALTIGQSCKLPQPREALVRAASDDDDDDVQRAAMRALLGCAPGIARQTFVAIARNTKQAVAVRTYAVLELANLKGSTAVTDLIDLLDDSRRRAFESEGAQRVAAAAATALGRIGDPRARDPLLRATRDEAYPDIQAAAAASLGSLCDKNVRRRLQQLVSSPQRTVSLAARRSLSTCR